jgi:multidrug efflux pump subunit AcrA (membrane-fusion protein)
MWLFAAACDAPYISPPELLDPVSVKADLAKAERGTVETVSQYKGIIRVKSEALSYGVTDLVFGAYHCAAGRRVKEGDLLVTLDTENLEESIERLREEIKDEQDRYALDNEALELEIEILQAEYRMLSGRAAESKKLDVEYTRLLLEQARERQSLWLRFARAELDGMLAERAAAEIRAPFDGIITYLADKAPGDRVDPFSGLAYISDGKELYAEYAGMTALSVPRGAVVKGAVGQNRYDLEYAPLSPGEVSYYALRGLYRPVRFTAVNPDDAFTPGAYVDIYIHSDIAEDALCVPVNALYADVGLGDYVYVLEDGQKTLRPVETGVRSAVSAEIISGLSEGEEVFVKK